MEVTEVRPGDILLATVSSGTTAARMAEIDAALKAVMKRFALAGCIVFAEDVKMEVLRLVVDPSESIERLQEIAKDLASDS